MSIIKPLQELTKNQGKWMWSELQQATFESVMKLISSWLMVIYYNTYEDLTLENDAWEHP